jgi:hypothetical protein
MIKAYESAGSPKLCPLCRVAIDEAAIIKKALTKEKPTKGDVNEMFELQEIGTLPVPVSDNPPPNQEVRGELIMPPAQAP